MMLNLSVQVFVPLKCCRRFYGEALIALKRGERSSQECRRGNLQEILRPCTPHRATGQMMLHEFRCLSEFSCQLCLLSIP